MEGWLRSRRCKHFLTEVILRIRIDILEVGDRILLYVVNHSQSLSKESIEKFEVKVETNELIWLKTITHREIYSINDITLLGEDEFYATNDHYFSFRFKLLRAIETFTMMRLGSIIYCKDEYCEQKTAKNMHFPNGIINYDGTLMVAQSGVQEVARFKITENRDLVPINGIKVPAGMDNFWFDGEKLTVTGHLKPWVS